MIDKLSKSKTDLKVCILGASGLIGHRLYASLSDRFADVIAVLHGTVDRFELFELFDENTVVEDLDVSDWNSVETLLDDMNPDVVLNCAGITKRRSEVNEPLIAVAVNALFPHQLANWAKGANSRIIHFSTDCVFDGASGGYTEVSVTTAQDAYGQTKALGEIRYDHCLTLRSSFIGQELSVHSELLDWFLQQDGKTVKGFTKALYSGISTLEMSRIVGDIISSHKDLSGLYQLSISDPISKFDLLCLAREAYNLDVEIVPEDKFVLDASLNGDALRNVIDLQIPDWKTMMRDLADERDFYAKGNK